MWLVLYWPQPEVCWQFQELKKHDDNPKKKFFFLLPAIGLILSASIVRAQTSCDSTCNPSDSSYKDCLSSLTELCQTQVSQLQSQANTLSNQIAQFNAQIKLATLKISQTEAQITLLGGRIDQLGDSLVSLTAAFSARAVETYKLSRFENNFTFILSASDLSDAVSRFHYLQKIEDEDRSLLDKLQTAQTTYQGQKADQETLQKQLQTQEANLNNQKKSKADLLTQTQGNENKYKTLLSQAQAELASFAGYASSQGGGSILSNQTVYQSDWNGYYYNQRDSQWGNMFLGGTNYLMKDSGCFITSVAMLATHSGKNIKPSDIAQLSAAITSAGYLKWSFSVNGVNVSIFPVTDSLDSELKAGHSVMVELSFSNTTDKHYIVLKSGSNGNYIMNDPFLENGGNKNFTDKYTTGNITQVFTVSFN